MELLVIRHAIAEEREVFARTGQDDSLRPLTEKGRERMRRGATGLARIASRPTLLVSSPYVRARETAEIVAEAFGHQPVELTGVLVPDAMPEEFLGWLDEHKAHDPIAIVGHEPHLSQLVSWLMTGEDDVVIELKKGAACLLDLGSSPDAGSGTLRWALAPAQLRSLAP